MKCIKCGNEQTTGGICHSCLSKWTEMRSVIWGTLTEVHGVLTRANHPIFIKETKRLEKIWRKDKDNFMKEIELLKSKP